MTRVQYLKNIFAHNKKVAENYVFMTVLQLLNSFFYILIYPYLIRTLGLESYGLYAFAWSIIWYFITIVAFGFDMPAVKAIAENPNDKLTKEKILSCVFTAKIYVELLSLCLFAMLLFSIPKLREHYILFLILFAQTFTNIIFPQWYYQGIQKMRTVTVIQLIFKLLSLPFIFLLVKNPNDVNIFAVLMSAASILGGVTAMLMIRFKENLQITWQSVSTIKGWYKDGLPFFLSNGVGMLKEQSVVQIIGIFLGMKDVAIYDLANKIIMLPRVLFTSINGAIFPKIIANINNEKVKKIIHIEMFMGITVIAAVILCGKFAVQFLGGTAMLASYPVAIILSVTVGMYLVVIAIHYFIFIPRDKYYYITINQIVAIAVFLLVAVAGLFFVRKVYVMAAAIAIASVAELIFSSILARKLRKTIRN